MTTITTRPIAQPASTESIGSAVSWAAVIAGAVVASALSLMLVTIGSGIGLVSISPWGHSGASAAAVGALALAWFIAVQLFAYGAGGYIAGRLRTRWSGTHTDEVFFRDTAHGFLVWAVGTLVTAALLVSAVTSAVSGVAQVGGAALGGAGSALSSAAGAAAGGANPTGYFSDMLFRSERPAAQANPSSARSEVGVIVARSLANGDLPAADRTYVGQVVARETGLSQADAEARVDTVIGQAKAAAQKTADTAKAAADAARKAGATAALWAFVALLVGAFAASGMATVGGRQRDED